MELFLNPNVAYLLLVGGFILSVLALFSPGTGLLEIGALFALVLAGYGIYNLPINAWALGLLVVGVFPFLLALRRSRRWIFLLVSMLALVIGSVFLFTQPGGGPAVHPLLAVVTSLAAVGLLYIIGYKGLQAVMRKPTFKLDYLIGKTGAARTEISAGGTAYVNGEEWSARSNTPIPANTPVRVVDIEGFVLEVEAVQPEQTPES